MFGAEQPKPAILRVIDVLIFIGEYAVEPPCPAGAVARVLLHDARRPEQQVAEVGRVGVAQHALIGGVDPGTGAQSVRIDQHVGATGLGDHRLDACRRFLRGDQAVVELEQPVAHHLQRVATEGGLLAAGEVQRLEHTLDDTAPVVGVQDVEAGTQPRDFRFDAQLPCPKAVERPDPVRGGPVTEARSDSGAHVGGRLVGERDGEDAGCGHLRTAIRCATAVVSVLVFPGPAPASTSTAPAWAAACACRGVTSARSGCGAVSRHSGRAGRHSMAWRFDGWSLGSRRAAAARTWSAPRNRSSAILGGQGSQVRLPARGSGSAAAGARVIPRVHASPRGSSRRRDRPRWRRPGDRPACGARSSRRSRAAGRSGRRPRPAAAPPAGRSRRRDAV